MMIEPGVSPSFRSGRSELWDFRARAAKKKAIVAVAHTLLVIIWNVLATDSPYTDLGADPGIQPPESVRACGVAPWSRRVTEDELPAAIDEFETHCRRP